MKDLEQIICTSKIQYN